MSDSVHLFLVEDNDDVALLIRRTFERAGHKVLSCRSGADALIVLVHSPFDLVVLDNCLPDMQGVQLLERLAKEGIAVPVLMITGQGDEQLATRAMQAGALDYVVKDDALHFLCELPKRALECVRRYRLEQKTQLLGQALESASDGILITDLQGTIVEVNAALVAQTGYSREELLGQTPRLFRSGLHPPEFYAQMWQTILARQNWSGELTNRRKDGQLRQTHMTISPIFDKQGRLTHFVGIQRDVTEQKQLERQLLQMQKMQSVNTLAGGIAHEFNNLLAGINGYAALGLREEGLTDNLRTFLGHIVNLSERAAALARQLLTFARKPALTRQRVLLSDLLRSTVDLITRTLHQQAVLELPDETSDSLFALADANQLQQALVNLALNARDAIRERQSQTQNPEAVDPRVHYRLQAVTFSSVKPGFPHNVPPGEYLRLSVEDHGTGMTPEVLNQALDPFFTTKEVGQGTGLGLPMVFGIVQGHQGYLNIESQPGQGTRVELYLPRSREQAGPVDQAIMDNNLFEPENHRSRHILVVDDEEVILDVVQRFLEIAGHQVVCVRTGQEAIDHLLAGNPVDLMILDLMMPGENPEFTLRRVRQRLPKMPVLVCTGLSGHSPAVAELLQQPHTSILRKPFRMNELWYAVVQAEASSGHS